MRWPCLCRRRSPGRIPAPSMNLEAIPPIGNRVFPRNPVLCWKCLMCRLLPKVRYDSVILKRWYRIGNYAFERKRLNVLTSALGELLKTFRRRRDVRAILDAKEGRLKTPRPRLGLCEFHWQRFSRHVLKVHSLGQLSGGLLSYLKRLGGLGREFNMVSAPKIKKRKCTVFLLLCYCQFSRVL